MRHVRARAFVAPTPVAALALGVTVPAASRVLIPAPRRAQRFTPSGAAATCSAKALAPVAARADEHLAPAPGTQKQAGIVHCSPRRGGLDDPRLPGNTALGAVRQCGSGRSLGRDRQVDVVRGCAGLPDHCDLTPTAERRHHTGAPRRHLLIGNIGSGGRQRQAPGRGTGTTQSSSAPIPQSQFTRAVRRITALSQSRLQTAAVGARASLRWRTQRRDRRLRLRIPRTGPTSVLADPTVRQFLSDSAGVNSPHYRWIPIGTGPLLAPGTFRTETHSDRGKSLRLGLELGPASTPRKCVTRSSSRLPRQSHRSDKSLKFDLVIGLYPTGQAGQIRLAMVQFAVGGDKLPSDIGSSIPDNSRSCDNRPPTPNIRKRR